MINFFWRIIEKSKEKLDSKNKPCTKQKINLYIKNPVIHAVFFIRNRFIRKSSQIRLLIQETNLARLNFSKNSKKNLCAL